MIVGVGIDAVSVERIEEFDKDSPFIMKTLTEEEREAEHGNFAEYYASRFAVKEAATKALAPALAPEVFNLRQVATLCREDGSPYIVIDDYMESVMEMTGVTSLHVSITHDGGLAIAVVIAESDVTL